MFAAKITAMSKTLAPPLASLYLPTFSMLLLLTSTYATEIGPLLVAAGLALAGVALAGVACATPAVPANASARAPVAIRAFHLDLGPRIVDQAPLLDEGEEGALGR